MSLTNIKCPLFVSQFGPRSLPITLFSCLFKNYRFVLQNSRREKLKSKLSCDFFNRFLGYCVFPEVYAHLSPLTYVDLERIQELIDT